MILDMFSLKGKVAIVTGANTGLGQGMCVALAQAGADIVGVARRDCDETKKLVEEAGSSFLQVKADLSSMEPIDIIIKSAVERYGHIDILVNNAGIIDRKSTRLYFLTRSLHFSSVRQQLSSSLRKTAEER